MSELPVSSLKDAVPFLRRPFTPAAVKFKLQTKGGLVVAHIDARLAAERINHVCPQLWTGEEYTPTTTGLMWCALTIDGSTRRDVGEGVGKALVSDALKRAAVKFGVGVSLYAIPKMWVSVAQGTAKKNDKDELAYITDKGEAYLRGEYTKWLTSHGIEAFGEALNHGDADNSAGDGDAPFDPETGEIQPEAPTIPLTENVSLSRAQELVKHVWEVGVEDKLQEAAAFALRAPIGDCSTREKAVQSLMVLTPSQGDKLGRWIDKKADELAVDEANAA